MRSEERIQNLPLRGADYPQRPPYFAHWFLRLLTKEAAANKIGPEACWMLANIVIVEDAKRYSEAPTFWNEQLRSICGIKSDDSLCRIRNRCIDWGWLHYEPGTKSVSGVYWVTVPSHLQHQSAPSLGSLAQEKIDSYFAVESREKTEGIPRESRGNPERKLGTSNPIPEPNPIPPPGDGWGGIFERINQAGVSRKNSPGLLKTARARGLPPEHLTAILDHYDSTPGAWGPGALYHRLLCARHDLPPAEGWLPPSAEYLRRQRESVARTRHEETQARAEADRAFSEAQRAKYRQLELQFGEEIDRTPVATLLTLLQPESQQFFRSRGGQALQTPLLRRELLLAFERMYEHAGRDQ